GAPARGWRSPTGHVERGPRCGGILNPRAGFCRRLRPPGDEIVPSGPPRRETYTHGHAPAGIRHHGQRTAEEAAAFLLPELRPGMRLLDVGCGPGSITRGLAERLVPGEVVGVDLSAETLAGARAEAAARGLSNLRYQEGSVYALPFG